MRKLRFKFKVGLPHPVYASVFCIALHIKVFPLVPEINVVTLTMQLTAENVCLSGNGNSFHQPIWTKPKGQAYGTLQKSHHSLSPTLL